jgi:hypothetical protein
MTKDINNRLFGRKRYFNSKNLYMPKQESLDDADINVKTHISDLLNNATLVYSNSYLNKISNEIIEFNEYILCDCN